MTKIFTPFVFFMFCALITDTHAQTPCPDALSLTNNSHCMFVSWVTPPSPLPNLLTTAAGNYNLDPVGDGSFDDPALYKLKGGQGSCNASQTGYTGEITFPDGTICTYENGSLQVPLPVTLVDFRLNEAREGIIIEWATMTEIQNRAFIVQRSADGKAWENIANVPGKGTSQELHSYHVLDRDPLKGLNFYRLVQEDIDGTKTFYAVKTIRFLVDQTEVIVFPNPARSLVSISSPEDGRYAIITTTGKTVQEGVFQGGQSLDVSRLSPGFYLIKVWTNGLESTQRLLIQE